jgi:hypothetical protein
LAFLGFVLNELLPDEATQTVMSEPLNRQVAFTFKDGYWFLSVGGSSVRLTVQILHHLYVESGMLLQQNIKEPPKD